MDLLKKYPLPPDSPLAGGVHNGRIKWKFRQVMHIELAIYSYELIAFIMDLFTRQAQRLFLFYIKHSSEGTFIYSSAESIWNGAYCTSLDRYMRNFISQKRFMGFSIRRVCSDLYSSFVIVVELSLRTIGFPHLVRCVWNIFVSSGDFMCTRGWMMPPDVPSLNYHNIEDNTKRKPQWLKYWATYSSTCILEHRQRCQESRVQSQP